MPWEWNSPCTLNYFALYQTMIAYTDTNILGVRLFLYCFFFKLFVHYVNIFMVRYLPKMNISNILWIYFYVRQFSIPAFSQDSHHHRHQLIELIINHRNWCRYKPIINFGPKESCLIMQFFCISFPFSVSISGKPAAIFLQHNINSAKVCLNLNQIRTPRCHLATTYCISLE